MVDLPEPIIDWLKGQDGLTLALTLGAWVGLFVALWQIARRVWPGLNALILFINSLGKLPTFMVTVSDRLDRMEPTLNEVRHEVFPNGGGALRDDVETLMLQVDQLKAHTVRDFERIDELEQTINRRLELKAVSRTTTGETPIETFPTTDTPEES